MSLRGGEETHILDRPMHWYNWALTRSGIYFINNGVQPEGPVAFIKTSLKARRINRHVNGRIEFFDFATGEITPIHSLEKPASDFGGMAISPDGKYLLYGQKDADDSYNMLVKNFR